jgi:hypothetical protein
MKTELDLRWAKPESNNIAEHRSFLGVRLYPETNAEFAALRQLVTYCNGIEEMGSVGTIHYLIKLEEKAEKEKK